jgi:hypothetical protein
MRLSGGPQKGPLFFINNAVKNFSDMFYIYKSTNKINNKFYIGRCKGPIEIIEETNENNNGEREIYWIDKLKPQYNATLGGDGGTLGRQCPEHVKEATRQSRIISVKDRKTGKIYESMKEARKDTGVLESSISRSIKYNGPGSRWEKLI